MPKIKTTTKVTSRGGIRRANTRGKSATVKTGTKRGGVIKKRKMG